MKKILITGKNSYIGTSFEKWMGQYSNEYLIEKIDVRGEEWKNKDFSSYDIIIHLAAIVHKKNVSKQVYYLVNRDLAIDVAKKSKESGVKQFIFFSTMSVYGLSSGIINKDTLPNPKTYYGQSKYEAEQMVMELQDKDFKICIVRPPIVYGKNSKGNYQRLVKVAKYCMFFPDSHNKRSMIYIDNLSRELHRIIEKQTDGYVFPQNFEYVNTYNLVKTIRKHNKSLKTFPIPFKIIKKIRKATLFSKVFGDLIYSKDLSKNSMQIEQISFDKSIQEQIKNVR